MTLSVQLIWLFVLPIPVACIAWTVTKEAIFKETREYCIKKSEDSKTLLLRKFFYLFTCEYCFSHYITLFFLVVTDYTLLLNDWRGFIIAGFSLVWISNLYMTGYSFIRQAIKKEIIKIRNAS